MTAPSLISLSGASVVVVGAGIMGSGIAQVAAQAGHDVMMYDMRSGAAAEAKAKLARTLDVLVAKGTLNVTAAALTLSRIRPIEVLQDAAAAGLIVEAIAEKLDAKRALFGQLEAIVSPACILASNTSSISITAIANGLQHPGRLVGMHFFNPVPVMKLVEVVSGLQTGPAIASAIFELCKVWGKVPVHARSTPGFIVNRIARPYYAETLALLQEQASTPAVLDACMRAAGFRMGACELMDLIGHDTNFSVTSSVYEANFYDKRFVPSIVQRELVDGGLLGRKSGQGFYSYTDNAPQSALSPFEPAKALPAGTLLEVHGSGAVAEHIVSVLKQAGGDFVRHEGSDWIGLAVDGAMLRLTDGRPASQLGSDVAVFDLPLAIETGMALAWAPSSGASEVWVVQASAWLRCLGFNAQRIADVPGLVVARTVAMLINEAADAVHQGVCTPQGADTSMKLGVNYPAGPFEWLARWSSRAVAGLLDALDEYYRGERYRVSVALRHHIWQTAHDQPR